MQVPEVVYHGTDNVFDTFSFDKIGRNGMAEGVGFYFTDSLQTAQGYGKNILKCHIELNKPITADTKKLTPNQIGRIINEATKIESEMYGSDLKDTFLSNCVDTYSNPWKYCIDRAVGMIYSKSKSNVEMLNELAFIAGNEVTNRAIIKATGYDGIISTAPEREETYYIVFTPEQITVLDRNIYEELNTILEGYING